jgi:DNA (cytosine-5)-methyltransferase 1
MIRLATIFSGIGSIEQALIRLGIEHDIVFACDNGDVELNLLEGDDLLDYKRLIKLRSKKILNEDNDIERLNYLSILENQKAEYIRETVRNLSSKEEKRKFVEDLYKKYGKGHNFVRDAYLANYKIDQSNFHLDVRFFDGRDYRNDKEIDLLVGGSPCQAFSAVGAKYGLNDTRGTLFYEFARIVQETQPRVFIYENVRGLLTHDNGHTWKVMNDVLQELNYRLVEPKILNASDYGIPQSRRRIFVIGIRDDIRCNEFQYPDPIELKYTMQDFLEDNCAYGCFRYDKRSGKLAVSKIRGSVDKKFILTPAVQKYVLAGGTANYKTSQETDLPIARTLMKMMTQHHRAGVDNYITVQKEPLVLRQLSDREALRLMGYPDEFKIVVSSMQTLRQAGNSIVVDVMMAIVKEIYKTGVYNYE